MFESSYSIYFKRVELICIILDFFFTYPHVLVFLQLYHIFFTLSHAFLLFLHYLVRYIVVVSLQFYFYSAVIKKYLLFVNNVLFFVLPDMCNIKVCGNNKYFNSNEKNSLKRRKCAKTKTCNGEITLLQSIKKRCTNRKSTV